MEINDSKVSEFIILGFSTSPEMETFIYILIFIIYIGALIGNLSIFILSITDSALNIPMYFFLGFLSFVDVWSISATIPRMLSSYIIQSKVISYNGCVAQLFFMTWSIGVELLLLTVMAYDRYIAITNPLRYVSIMNQKVCFKAAMFVIVTGLLNSLTHTYCTFRLPYCRDNKINHFFCEIMPLLKLACADIYINEIVVYTSDFILGICSFLFICVSYGCIIKNILKIRSTEGKHKAFSTCASHVIVVSMYYGAVIFTYIQPKNTTSVERGKTVSALYAVLTPALNPIVYSLRNTEVKNSFQRAVRRLI